MTLMTGSPRMQKAQAPFRRRAEVTIASIGLAGAAVLQGGFALLITRSDDETLRTGVVPALRDNGVEISDADADVALNTLAAWFGYSLVLVALLWAVGLFFAHHRPRRRSTGRWFVGAGLACLVGTQLLLYPVAFFFFVAAALFAVRKPLPRSTP
ncbi:MULTISPECIES: hypothetical protein [Microbacterium]|uniref:hypothetical protein n=1 Tax=Microbacterium TaxID=33882 RepID=UPI000D648F5B|nr:MULTISPECIES: hypothetical protein [Microbacterium]